MNDDEMADIIRRMMRDLAQDDDNPNAAPRCEGCGKREPLEPYQLRGANGSVEPVNYCAECRALADLEG